VSKKAVILLSGGLDSATVVAIARAQGFTCYTLSFNYGQRAEAELAAAAKISKDLGAAEHRVFSIDTGQFGGSALTDTQIDVPTEDSNGSIPITYVPARNTVFLSIALGWAEVLGARHIFFGANDVDYSGYPDCRPEFIKSFEHTANLATKAGVEGDEFYIMAPLLSLTKDQIIAEGLRLGVNYADTISCYQPDAEGRACRECESCALRAQGFIKLSEPDPTRYIPTN